MKNKTETFIKKAQLIHRGKYDYSKLNYINYTTPITVTCKKCNTDFNPTPSNHILGSGCPYCGQNYNRNKKLTTKKFISMSQKIHGEMYDYSKSVYVNAKTKITIVCKKCEMEFNQLPRAHIYEKQGCPKCKMSHGETKISNILSVLNIPFIPQHRFKDCKGKIKPLPFDFFIPSLNICIEYDGKQHYDKSSKYYNEELINNDKIKTNYCDNKKIKLIRITQREFNIIENIIKKWLVSL
jgi:Zn finger protein HypA/HybF involved in hydrogenase expression/very-short-patch-repair endonuclease